MSTAILMKKELMLGGLTCAHCAETIGEVVKNINGVQRSHMNFVSKKLILEIDSCYDEDEVIKEVKKDFEEQLAISKEVTYEEWCKRPLIKKIVQFVLYIFAVLF